MKPLVRALSGAVIYRHVLTDAISCTVIKDESGKCELTLKYPVLGAHFDKLILHNTIYAPTSRIDKSNQSFEIIKILQNIDGIVEIKANHIAYALGGYPIRAFSESARTPGDAISAIINNCIRKPGTDAFEVFAADIGDSLPFGISRPTTFRQALYGRGGVLATYGGALVADNRIIRWCRRESVGEDKGVIRYGINLRKFKRSYDVSDTYTHAYVYWDKAGTHIEPQNLVQLGDNSSFRAATIMDLSKEFDEQPTPAQLEAKAKSLAAKDVILDPEISLDISFVPLRQTDEYKDLKWLEDVDLYDTVKVEIPMYGSSTARISGLTFDVLAETYTKVTVGDPVQSIDKTIAKLL